MRRRLAALALVVSLLFLAVPAARADGGWTIARFDTDLVLQPSGVLEVTESILADFAEPKHGIFREIPIRYAVNAHLYDLRFRLLSVDGGHGEAITAKTTYEGNRVKIRIGDADRTVTGRQLYRIRYSVQRAVLWEGNRAWEHEQAVLRWNATGTDWPVPIVETTVLLHLPRDLADADLTTKAWTGRFGATGQDYKASRPDARTVRFEAGHLDPGEGFTIEAYLPADAVQQPSRLTQLFWWMSDNFPYFLIPATLLGCLGLWYARGRDLPGRGTIVVEYEPPDDLRPAEVGTLLDERVDLRDLTATLIDLAVRGYLTIREEKTEGWLTSSTDYEFNRRKGPDGLKTFERTLFNKLFSSGEQVKLSELQQKYYTAIPAARKQVYEALTNGRYFDGNPTSVRTRFFVLGMLLLGVALGLCAIVQGLLVGRVFPVPLVLSGIFGLVCIGVTSLVMPRKTSEGRIAWERIRGLEEYIRRAEVEDLEAQQKQGVFEKLLPYAIAFNLSDRWGRAFEGLYKQPPDWYQTGRTGPDFSTWYLVNSINNSVHAMNTTLPSQPRAESGGSGGWSSGGFSGGGSVGGGFGGGGGGSW